MTATEFDHLIVPALSALASAPEGTLTLPEFIALLETREGSTDEAAAAANSPESRLFEQTFRIMIDQLAKEGLVLESGGIVQITQAGRNRIGRR